MFDSKWLGNALQAVVLALMFWSFRTTQGLEVQQAVMASELLAVKELVVDMQTDFVTRTEFTLKMDGLQEDYDRLRDRVRTLEGDGTLLQETP